MAVGTAAAIAATATAGAAMYGAKKQAKAADSASAANLLQQQRALEFQKEMTEKGIGALDEGRLDAKQLTTEAIMRNTAEATQRMMDRGMGSSSMAVQMNRAAAYDAAKMGAQIEADFAAKKAAVYGQQDFPMVMQQGPQGSWANDYGSLALGVGKMLMSGSGGGGGGSTDQFGYGPEFQGEVT